MIVSCEHCRTQFRLDDSKVPETGARVRCSKCNHAFYIPPPGQGDDLMAAEQAREALQGVRDELGDTDSDWQFNDDAPAAPEDPGPREGRGLDAARQAVDGLLGDLARSRPEPGEPGEAPPQARQEAPDEDPGALFGTLDDDFPDEPGTPAPSAEPVAPPAPVRGPWEETALGSPERRSPVEEPAGMPAGAVAIGKLPTLPRWKLLEGERAAERARAAADEPTLPALGRALRLGLQALGWLATLALLAFGTWGALRPAAPRAAVSGSLEAPGFRALDVRGRWIENAVAGPIYVVSGSLRAEGAGPAAGGGRLAVRLLDARGEPLEALPTPVGPPFSDRALREREPAELLADQRRAALEFARLHPGESVPFQAIFRRLPPEAVRFDLERGAGP